MPRNYTRTSLRASWSERDMKEAMEKVKNKTLGVNEASRVYKIPSRTLRRHILKDEPNKSLGRSTALSYEQEKKLVSHIKKLEKVGFAPDRKDVKKIAYRFGERLGIEHPFSHDTKEAGNAWFNGFLRRNPEISTRKSEGLSLARAYGVNRTDVKEFFDVLKTIYQENDLLNNPGCIYNMDETGIQVNNKAGKVLASKGAKDVYTLTSSEKGENVTVVACCNGEGNFLPPVLIFKGTYTKPQFFDGLPPGSDVYMNKKSSYINSDLFLKWFQEIFLRKKAPGKALLILDGHSSHSNNIQLLEIAEQNDVTLLCLPSHTTHALQPLDRCFFKPLKTYFFQEAKTWMINNKDKKLTRYDVSKLIGKAWGKSASVSNGISALKSTGIFPFDPNAIPDHFFSLSDALYEQNLIENNPEVLESELIDNNQEVVESVQNAPEPQPGPSGLQLSPSKIVSPPGPSGITPSKMLTEIRPVPKIPLMISKRKQKTVILTSPENMQKRKMMASQKKNKEQNKIRKLELKKKVDPKKKKGLNISVDSSEDEEVDVELTSEAELSDEGSRDKCIECTENYYKTASTEDWVECITCKGWLHEFCTMYLPNCNSCGRKAKRQAILQN